MGEAFSKAVQPEELATFKKLPPNTLLDNIEIPERAENRRPTDRHFFIVFFVVLAVLLPFLIYTMIYSDLDRLRGYDQCGNVCGKKNSKYDQWSCTGKDYTDKKYLEYKDVFDKNNWELTPRDCVTTCSNGAPPIFGQCFSHQTDNFNDAALNINDFLKDNAWRLALACVISLCVTLGMIFLFRTATAAVVWGILGGVCIFCTIVVGILWYVYFQKDKNATEEQSKGLLYSCIIVTVFVLILICVIVFLHKRIQLVIQLFKEASKAIFAMPLMVVTPLLTFFVSAIVIIILAFTTVVMATAGNLHEITTDFYNYELNPVMIFTIAFNFWMAFWGSQFIIGIQYMVIAGAVAKWYWAKDKHNLYNPISTSAKIVFRFHLGSIALGSMIITLVAILRAALTALTKNDKLKICVDYCMERIETFIKFLSKNAYIIQAMHGKPFLKSGRRAARIIFQNALNIVAINSIGDFVIAMAQILIVLISLLITYALFQGVDQTYVWVSYVIVGVLSLSTAMIFFSLFETTIDTIFICFCEDSMLNDGMARPYAMSRNLMEFVENSKKVWVKK